MRKNLDESMTEKDELILSQSKPYLTGSILCALLAFFCLFVIGLQMQEPAFWLCVLTIGVNILFSTSVFVKTRKIRK